MPGKPSACPDCGSGRVVKILYGLPVFSDLMKQDIDDGHIVLAGCCVEKDSPVWACPDCGHRW